MEINLPMNVKITEDKKGGYGAVVIRRSDEKEYPVMAFRNLTPAEVYVKFGAKVKEEESDTPELDAKMAVEKALRELNSKQNYTATEVQNFFLDVLNVLGGKEVDEQDEEVLTDGAE